MVPLVGLQSVIVALPGHFYFLFNILMVCFHILVFYNIVLRHEAENSSIRGNENCCTV